MTRVLQIKRSSAQKKFNGQQIFNDYLSNYTYR